MTQTVERKLTTVLCADMCGYSRLMEQDEEGTLSALKQARGLFEEEIVNFSGRIINMAGDAIIADFSSVVKALDCAVAIQTRMKNASNDISRKVPQFRIGLNLGDVIIEGNDIFGDGVNIAARLESLAPVGGISISGTVYDHIKSKRPLGFEYKGAKTVKNINGAVDLYALDILGEPKSSSTINKTQDTTSTAASEDVEISEEEEARIRKQVRKEAAFYRRAMGMGCIIFFLFLINIFTSPGYLWFFWPAMPIIFVTLMDALRIFGKGRHSHEWEEKRYRDLKARKGR